MSSSLPFTRHLGWPWAWWLALLGWLLVASASRVCAQQVLDYQYVDSLSQTLLEQQRWRALDSVGQAAIVQGSDYPALRRRLGASALATGHLAAALRHYGPAFEQNPLDDEARAGLAAAYLAFNQPGPAALLAGALPAETSRALRLPTPRAITQLEIEGNTLQTSEHRRGAGTYSRLSVGSRLSPRLSLSQDFSYYHQEVEQPRFSFPGSIEEHHIDQGQVP
jgi:hypothetical protein